MFTAPDIKSEFAIVAKLSIIIQPSPLNSRIIVIIVDNRARRPNLRTDIHYQRVTTAYHLNPNRKIRDLCHSSPDVRGVVRWNVVVRFTFPGCGQLKIVGIS